MRKCGLKSVKKKQKLDFIHRLKSKLKDYKDAIKFESRYKKIRFIERRKLERKLNHINKAIEKEKEEINKEKLKKEKEEIIEDINYVKYYPRTYKYYSLFPNKDAENEEMIKKREKMKQKIKFFLNNKKNKSHNINTKENEDNDNEINNEDKNEESEDKEESNDNIDDNDDEKKSEEEKEKKEKKKKNKENIVNKGQNDYESFKKKKAFKDNFFELDE